MKPIKIMFWSTLLLPVLFWRMADAFPATPGWFVWRPAVVQLSGILAIGVMSLAMLLALRPVWLEEKLNGLDKMYRLHKWLGISALALGLLHWWWAQGTKWMVDWGWLVKPERKMRPPAEPGMVEALLDSWHQPAEVVGEWAFYVALILLVLALVKRFPYRIFAKTHTILAALYLLLAWHSLVLLRRAYWAQPIGWLVALCLVAGSLAALLILFRRTGHRRKVKGQVAALEQDREGDTLRVEVELAHGWQGHESGQFAFVTSDKKEGAHPYTIATAWNEKTRRLAFVIKALGDHTRELPETLRVGHPVTVEGPYGCFTFDGAAKRQIWIGAGIGITPFLARLQTLRENPDGRAITLFHPVGAAAESLESLKTEAAAAGVEAHILISPRDGFLTGDRIRAAVPDWKEASLWFCGPAGFGKALKADFMAQGLSPDAFHQELFEMR
ncbi:MAG: ferric reductase-like transmembrane domain-containing protein [Zoogloeaceae bacterium]|nr:ferric reductase-like transmembrane domain-containing protein [Zoogloeaceae bacterium]